MKRIDELRERERERERMRERENERERGKVKKILREGERKGEREKGKDGERERESYLLPDDFVSSSLPLSFVMQCGPHLLLLHT